ncbi:hypothetical protein Ddc_22028 [Ditylenchus destructor]|nr:hypothetical protein Ddc_22028 [Ditylenchus destructor]
MEVIATLESISHIWSGQMLDINDHWSGVNSRSTDLLYKNPIIYTCRSLRIDAGEQRLPRELIGNPLFYTLPKVGFWWQTARQEIMEIVQQKTAFPQSDTMIAVGTKDREIGPVVEKIRVEFLAATEPCLLHLSIGFNEYELDQFDIPGSLRIENARTKEVLQWKIVDEDGPERNYDVYFDGHLCINIQRFCA